jgi:hypothetical protein
MMVVKFYKTNSLVSLKRNIACAVTTYEIHVPISASSFVDV